MIQHGGSSPYLSGRDMVDAWEYDPQRPENFPAEEEAKAYNSPKFNKALYYFARSTRIVANDHIWPKVREVRAYSEKHRNLFFKQITLHFMWDYLGVDSTREPRVGDIPRPSEYYDNYLLIATWWRPIKMPPDDVSY